MKQRRIAFFLVLSMCLLLLFGSIPKVRATQSRASSFSSAYTLTGNGADDIIAVAVAQIGASKSELGYTEDWCADFISDCALLAGIEELVPANGAVSSLRSAVIKAGADYWEYTSSDTILDIQKGDIVVLENGRHVALVESVDDDVVHCIDGNWGSQVSEVKRVDRSLNNMNNQDWHQYITTVLRPAYPSNIAAAYATDLTLQTNAAFSLMSEPGTTESIAASVEIGKTETERDYHATRLVQNQSGEYWYRLEDINGDLIGYLAVEEAELKSENWSVVVSGVDNPGNLELGKGYNVRGKVKTGGTVIQEIQALVYNGADTEGNAVVSSNVLKPNATSSDIYTGVNKTLYFSRIPSSGSYTYLVRVKLVNYHLESGIPVKTEKTIVLDETVTQFEVYTPSYQVTFDANYSGADYSYQQTVSAGECLAELPVLSRQGWKFVGWYSDPEDGEVLTTDTVIQADITVYAHWIEIPPDQSCGEAVYWSFDSGLLTIYGEGPMQDFVGLDQPWSGLSETVYRVQITEGVTSVGAMAFAGMNEIESVALPQSMRYIGDKAFVGCSSIREITIPLQVTNIEAMAFAYCNKLKDVYLYTGGAAIDSDAFLGVETVMHYLGNSGWTEENRTDYGGSLIWVCLGSVGDIDGNNIVNLKDVAALFRTVSGHESTDVPVYLLDMDGNGILSLRDVFLLYQVIS